MVPVKLAGCGSGDGAAQISTLRQTAARQRLPLLLMQVAGQHALAQLLVLVLLHAGEQRQACAWESGRLFSTLPSLQARHPWSARVGLSDRSHWTSIFSMPSVDQRSRMTRSHWTQAGEEAPGLTLTGVDSQLQV